MTARPPPICLLLLSLATACNRSSGDPTDSWLTRPMSEIRDTVRAGDSRAQRVDFSLSVPEGVERRAGMKPDETDERRYRPPLRELERNPDGIPLGAEVTVSWVRSPPSTQQAATVEVLRPYMTLYPDDPGELPLVTASASAGGLLVIADRPETIEAISWRPAGEAALRCRARYHRMRDQEVGAREATTARLREICESLRVRAVAQGDAPAAGADADVEGISGDFSGGLGREVVEAVIAERGRGIVEGCSGIATGRGDITVRFPIRPDGTVTHTRHSASAGLSSVGSCVAEEMRRLTFPAKGGALVVYSTRVVAGAKNP